MYLFVQVMIEIVGYLDLLLYNFVKETPFDSEQSIFYHITALAMDKRFETHP
jgi:hypothetical protein